MINEAIRSKVRTARAGAAVFAALRAEYTAKVGEARAAHSDRLCTRFSHYREGGLAWWKERCRAAAFNIVSASSRTATVIAPSPETLAWGGFLGGETVYTTDRAAEAKAEAHVADIIAGA